MPITILPLLLITTQVVPHLKHLVQLVGNYLVSSGVAHDFSVYEIANGSVEIEALTPRVGSLISQAAERMDWNIVQASHGEKPTYRLNGGHGVQQLYYQANRLLHKEMGVPWTAQLEKVWQHRLGT